MKIEIEFEEVQRLKLENQSQYIKIQELGEQLNSLNPTQLKSDAVGLAMDLFESYISSTFEKLGFEKPEGFYDRNVVAECGLQRLGKTSMFQSDKVQFTIEAKIANDFRRAYLRIGLITNDIEEEQ